MNAGGSTKATRAGRGVRRRPRLSTKAMGVRRPLPKAVCHPPPYAVLIGLPLTSKLEGPKTGLERNGTVLETRNLKDRHPLLNRPSGTLKRTPATLARSGSFVLCDSAVYWPQTGHGQLEQVVFVAAQCAWKFMVVAKAARATDGVAADETVPSQGSLPKWRVVLCRRVDTVPHRLPCPWVLCKASCQDPSRQVSD